MGLTIPQMLERNNRIVRRRRMMRSLQLSGMGLVAAACGLAFAVLFAAMITGAIAATATPAIAFVGG